MTGGKLPALHHLAHGKLQSQKTQRVGYGAPGLPHTLGRFLLCHVVTLHQGLKTGGFFHRIQILPLKILH